MSLTVPRAGNIAGRSANVQVATPDTGAAFAEFGNVMTQVGNKLVSEAADREMARGKMQMMQGMQDLRLQVEQIGDPDQIEAAYASGTKALREQIVGGMMPRNHADAALLFDEVAFSHGAAIGGRVLDLQQSQQRATLDQTAQVVIAGAATNDPETQAAYLDQYTASLDALVAKGVLNPEQRAAKLSEVTGGSQSARMTRLLSDDPAALVTAIDKGELGAGMDGGQVQTFRARGVAQVESNAAAAATDATRALTERTLAGKEIITEGTKVWRAGKPFASEADIAAIKADPELAAALKPELDEYANAEDLFSFKPGFSRMSLEGKKRMRAEEAARPADKAYQANRLTAMDAEIAEHEAALKGDGDFYGFVATRGLAPVQPLPDPSSGSVGDLSAALKSRARSATGLTVTGLSGTLPGGAARPAPYFTPDERETWGALAAPTASPADRAKLAAVIAGTPGMDAERAAKELKADPMFTFVGGGMAAGDLSARVAKEAFEGVRVLEAQEVKMPPVTERRTKFFTDMPRLFDDGVDGFGADESATMRAALGTADAIYAYRMRGKQPEGGGTIDQDVYSQSLHEAMGGSGTFGAGDATGGIATLSSYAGDYVTVLPKGVSADQITEAQDDIQARLYQAPSARNSGAAPVAAISEADWKGLSVDGSLPDIGGKLPDAATFRSLQLRPLGGDRYELIKPGIMSGSYAPITAAGGRPYVISLDAYLKLGGAVE